MNTKLIFFTAIISFILSFFVGIFSGIGFLIVLLRSAIISIVFAGLTIGVLFVCNKFLFDDVSDSTSSDSYSEANNSVIGNKVDITIDDEDLQQDEVSPHFVLTGQNQMLNKSDLDSVSNTEHQVANVEQKSQDINNTSNEKQIENDSIENKSIEEVVENNVISEKNSNFKPVSLGAAPANDSSLQNLEEFPNIDDTLASKNDTVLPLQNDEVDTFPDVYSSEEAVTDTDFASANRGPTKLSETMFPDGSMAESKDSTLMADAIRTILKKQE